MAITTNLGITLLETVASAKGSYHQSGIFRA